ncbi:hypothetical protein H3T55_16290 [Enterococcus sp. S22(2020)]|nr:hypothetical protein [Enterococcus sp. S23]MCA5017823.1 hypothetical protein [Enterococcus sp. S22(2020)]
MNLSNDQELEEFKTFLEENLLTKNEAMLITNQTGRSFNQSVATRQLQPIFESDGKGPAKVKLYLRSQVEEYAKNKKQINKK